MNPAHRRLVAARTNLQDEPCEFNVTGEGPPEAPDYGRGEVPPEPPKIEVVTEGFARTDAERRKTRRGGRNSD